MKLKHLPKLEDRLSEFRAQHRTHFRNPRRLRYSKQLLQGDFTNQVLDQVSPSVSLTMLKELDNGKINPIAKRTVSRSPLSGHKLPILETDRAARRKNGLDLSLDALDRTQKPIGDKPMSIASAALAKAAELRKSKPASAKKSTPAPKKQRAVSTGSRGTTEAENAKVAKLYKEGKNYGEISDAMGWTGKGDWPYSYTHGVINRLRKAGMLGYRRKPESKPAKKGKK